MSASSVNADRLLELTGIVCSKSASEADFAELNSILLANDASRQRYLGYCRMHVALRLELRAHCAAQKACQTVGVEEAAAVRSEADVAKLEVPPLAMPVGFLSTTLHSTYGYFSSGWPVAYLVATVIFAVGALVTSHIYVFNPVQVARRSASLPCSLSSHPFVVGRITGMVDCKWEKKGLGIRDWGLEEDSKSKVQGSEEIRSPIPNPQSLVSLGDKFILSSGLMEITYDTGAKVILQGPVTYEVESAAGGYLAVGKITARLERKVASGQWPVVSSDYRRLIAGQSVLSPQPLAPSPSSNPQSLIPNPFVVRTPTCTVTDLGTEFGIEVSKSDGTLAHVFKGVVEVQPADDTGKQQSRAVRLTENESVRVERPAVASGARRFVVRREAAGPESFVRKLPSPKKPLPVKVVTQFRLGEDDRGAMAGRPAAEEAVNRCHHYYHLERHGSPSYTTDTAAPGSTLAMSFNAANGDYFSNSRWYIAPTDNFIIEAWVCFNKLAYQNAVVVYMGDTANNGYGIMVKSGNWAFLFGGPNPNSVYADSGVKCEPGRWTHLALVCERGQTRLWIDGQPAGKVHQGTPLVPDHLFLIGGNSVGTSPQTEYFDGQIDEVRLSQLLGPFQPEMLLLPAATPPPSEKHPGAETNNQSR